MYVCMYVCMYYFYYYKYTISNLWFTIIGLWSTLKKSDL